MKKGVSQGRGNTEERHKLVMPTKVEFATYLAVSIGVAYWLDKYFFV